MGGGTQQTSSSTSSNSPQVTNLTNQLASGLSGLVSQGSAVYDKPLYTGLSGTTTGGVNQLAGAAGRGQTGLNQAFDATQGLVNSGGYNAALTQAQGGYQGQIANGGYNADMNAARSGIQNYLQESQANAPGYASLRSGVIDDTLAATNGAFNASGRFGGGANVNQANRGIASAVGALDYQNYDARLGRQLQGNSALAGIGQQAYGNTTNALAGLSGVGQQAISNQMGAAGQLPGQFAATLAPGQAQIAAGSILDADALARRQAEAQLFDAQNNRTWKDYAQASSILAGTAGAAGQTTTNTTPAPNPFQSILGGAIGLGSLFL